MERVKGLEPSISAWKANVLPLHYTRVILLTGSGAGEETRTHTPMGHWNLNPARLPIPPRPHDNYGDPSGIRTRDTLIKSQVLYRLS